MPHKTVARILERVRGEPAQGILIVLLAAMAPLAISGTLVALRVIAHHSDNLVAVDSHR